MKSRSLGGDALEAGGRAARRRVRGGRRSANGLLAQIASASSVPPRSRYSRSRCAFGVGEVEILAAVHEDHVVAEQVRVADVDQLGRGADLQFQFALRGGAQQVQQCAGRVVAAAAVAELGDFDDAAADPVAEATSPSSGVSKLCSLPLGSRLVA